MPYDREKAAAYARTWALDRNPQFTDFEGMGGDCTNFVSQCLYAGCGVMNFTPVTGWFYRSLNNRAPAWTGVPFLYNFLTSNQGPGPYGRHLPLENAMLADVIQLSHDGRRFHHSLLIVSLGNPPAPENILVAAHTNDVYNKPLNAYTYAVARLIHMEGARW